MIATTGLDERPRDPETGGPVPFVCEDDAGRASVRLLDKKRVTRCALSRICGVCGDSLGRPVAFLGTSAEHDALAFHVPAVHPACGDAVLRSTAGAAYAVLGQDAPVADWVLVTTSGFEHERPQPGATDRRPTFRPHAALQVRAYDASGSVRGETSA